MVTSSACLKLLLFCFYSPYRNFFGRKVAADVRTSPARAQFAELYPYPRPEDYFLMLNYFMNFGPSTFSNTLTHFWTAVEDCVVEFHQFERGRAAERVTTLWRELPKGPGGKRDEPSFEDMIYHAEPWYIACNSPGGICRSTDSKLSTAS